MTDDRPVITSASHPQAVALRKLLSRPQRCRREGVFVLDGSHLFEEALRSPHEAAFIFATPRFLADPSRTPLLEGIRARGWRLRPVTDRVLAGLAPTEHPQGIVGVFERPTAARSDSRSGARSGAGSRACSGARSDAPSADRSGPVSEEASQAPAAIAPGGFVLAGLQDPGNLGALARTAFALGCDRLFTTAGTVDPYHARALRGSSGALLRMHISPDLSIEELLAETGVREGKARLAALVPRGGSWPPRIGSRTPLYLALGSEGAGLDPALEAHCTFRWTIPIRPEAESLGVAAAGAIALYEALVADQG